MFWERAAPVRRQSQIFQLIVYNNCSILAPFNLIVRVTQTVKKLPAFYEIPVLPLFFTVVLLLKFKDSEGKYLYILGDNKQSVMSDFCGE